MNKSFRGKVLGCRNGSFAIPLVTTFLVEELMLVHGLDMQIGQKLSIFDVHPMCSRNCLALLSRWP